MYGGGGGLTGMNTYDPYNMAGDHVCRTVSGKVTLPE